MRPGSALKHSDRVLAWKCWRSTQRSRSRSSLVSTGCGSSMTRACSGPSRRMLPSPPTKETRLMTISSRMESIGGLVTWAKSWWK